MQWYYSKNGTQLGPVELAELKSKLSSGEISSADLVWKEGMADWIPASRVSELQTVVTSPTSSPVSSVSPDSPYVSPSSNQPMASPGSVTAAPVGTGKATASMVLGICSIVTGLLCGCFGGIPCGVLAIVFGNQFKKIAEANPAFAGELGKVKAGIIMGWIGIVLGVIATIVGVAIQYAAGAFDPATLNPPR